MFKWSRGEVWLAVVMSALVVIGGAGHLWLTYERLQGATVVVEAAGATMEQCDDGTTETGAASLSAAGEGRDDERVSNHRAGETAQADGRININTAQPSELQRLPGIGPALAARIVAYREAWGPFSSIEDIMEVSGIGARTFENIKDMIKVD